MRELPKGWCWVTLREIAAIKGGLPKGNKRTNDQPRRMVPYLRVANVQRGYLDLNEVKEIEATEAQVEDLELRPGDVLFNEGGDRDKLGRGWVWDGEIAGCIHQNHVFRARLRPNTLLSKFLSHYGNSEAKRYFENQGKQTTNLASISLSTLAALPVPVPPLVEQERILAKLEELFSELDAGVEALKRAQIRLTRYRQSVFNAAVTGALTSKWSMAARPKGPLTYRPSPVDRPKQIPSEWAWVSFERVAVISGGLTKNKLRSEMTLRLPYLRVANVYADDLRLDEIQEIGVTEGELPRVRLESGDLLIVEGNGSQDQIGRVAVWDGSISPCLHQNHLIKARPSEALLPRFALIWLLSPLGRTYIVEQASSTSGLFTLSISKVEGLPVPVPSIEEQQRIIEEFDALTTELDALERAIQNNLVRAESLRQSILERAFRGELVPQDPADEPADAALAHLRKSSAAKAGQGMSTKRSYVRKTKTAAGGA